MLNTINENFFSYIKKAAYNSLRENSVPLQKIAKESIMTCCTKSKMVVWIRGHITRWEILF